MLPEPSAGNGSPKATVLYRGPSEPSRLIYIIEAAARAYGGPPKLICLAPDGKRTELRERLDKFVPTLTSVTDYRVLDGRTAALPSTISALRGLMSSRTDPIVAVGFSSAVYAKAVAKGPLVWCITGIPEERLLYQRSLRRRVHVGTSWRSARLGRRPDLVVTVSEPMSRLVEQRLGQVPTFAAPNCVDHSMFGVEADARRTHLTYLGSGAPWQCLDHVGAIWRALHQRAGDLRFRVISRDRRTRALAHGLPEGAVEFVAAQDWNMAARFLWQAEGGFMIRQPHLVNQVSYPTKFGEYLAAGAPVIATDVGWDPVELIRRTGCGLVVPWDGSAEAIAESILEFRERGHRADLDAACRAAASSLDRAVWVERLAATLPR
jgi:glycosyltransferase involved in cell wall biosynthesis